ncbi:MAG TPA: substrate-binding domain-containing protein [Chthonomonadaceae bacterium]|nr:substrate-binding domain-containing protein [Chthonomonadaceae bacterium]
MDRTINTKTSSNGNSPLIGHILSTIEGRIRQGHYPAGHYLPTERALSQEFHASRSTLRLVLAELERRDLLIRAPGCRPLIAGSQRRAPSDPTQRHSLGLWISGDPADIGGALTALGVQRTLDPDQFRLVVGNPVGATLQECIRTEAFALARMARDTDIAGIILWYLGGETNLPALEALRAANMPLVFIDRLPPAGFEADYVGVDNEYASAEMVRHLLSCGHERIAYVANTDTASTVAERRAGYRKALQEAGIGYRKELVIASPFFPAPAEEDAVPSAEAAVRQLLDSPDAPTAIFAINDHIALLLLEALRQQGICVPQDVALAGFDDIERATPGSPQLTTVRQPFERMGQAAARLIRRRLDEDGASAYQHIILDTALIVRASTLPETLKPDTRSGLISG